MKLFRHLRDEQGALLTEAAISSLVVLALLFGICQMSYAMYLYHYASEAAREATRYAIVRGSTSCTNTPGLTNCGVTAAEIQTWVRSLGYPGVTASKVSVSTSWYSASGTMPTTWSACAAGTCNAPGNMVAVTVTYPLTFQIPFSSSFSLNLTSTSQMVISQ